MTKIEELVRKVIHGGCQRFEIVAESNQAAKLMADNFCNSLPLSVEYDRRHPCTVIVGRNVINFVAKSVPAVTRIRCE